MSSVLSAVARASRCPKQSFIETLIATAAIPKCVYMLENGRACKIDMDRVASAVTRAVFPRRQLRSVEVVLALLRKGHLIDPWQVWVVVTLVIFRRMYLRCEDVRQLIAVLWNHPRVATRSRRAGIAVNIYRVLTFISWEWIGPSHFRDQDGFEFGFERGDAGWWAHRVRDAARQARLRQADVLVGKKNPRPKRWDMRGLQQGVDVYATTHLLRGHASGPPLDPYHRGILEGMIAGAHWSCARLRLANILDTSACPCGCPCPNETTSYMIWKCPSQQSIRRKYGIVTSDEDARRLYHPATRICLIAIRTQIVRDLEQWRHNLGPRALAAPPAVSRRSALLPGHFVFEFRTLAGRILVWTDGGAAYPRIPLLTHSGSGVYFAASHVWNASFSTSGSVHSNQRAEAEALHYVVLTVTQPTHVRADSQYVVEALSEINTIIRDHLSPTLLERRSHSDVWLAIHAALVVRPSDFVVASWCKGHATASHRAAGLSTLLDTEGNNAADEFAGQAIRRCAPPPALVDAYHKSLTTLANLQRAVVEMVVKRKFFPGVSAPVHSADGISDTQLEAARTWHPAVLRATPSGRLRLSYTAHPASRRLTPEVVAPIVLQLNEDDPDAPPPGTQDGDAASDHSGGPDADPALAVPTRAVHAPAAAEPLALRWPPVWTFRTGYIKLTDLRAPQWRYARHLLAALQVWLEALRVPVDVVPRSVSAEGETWATLALSFEIGTGVFIPPTTMELVLRGGQSSLTIGDRAFHFAYYVRRLFEIIECPPPWDTLRLCCSLRPLGIMALVGITPRPVYPAAQEVERALSSWADTIIEAHRPGNSRARIANEAARPHERSDDRTARDGDRAWVPDLSRFQPPLRALVLRREHALQAYVARDDISVRLAAVSTAATQRREAERLTHNRNIFHHRGHLIPYFQTGQSVRCLLCADSATNGQLRKMAGVPCKASPLAKWQNLVLSHWARAMDIDPPVPSTIQPRRRLSCKQSSQDFPNPCVHATLSSASSSLAGLPQTSLSAPACAPPFARADIASISSSTPPAGPPQASSSVCIGSSLSAHACAPSACSSAHTSAPQVPLTAPPSRSLLQSYEDAFTADEKNPLVHEVPAATHNPGCQQPTRGLWGDVVFPRASFRDESNKAAFEVQMRLDRARGRVAHLALAARDHLHLPGPLVAIYRQTWTRSQSAQHRADHGRDIHTVCKVCGSSARPATSAERQWKLQLCPYGGTSAAISCALQLLVEARAEIRSLEQQLSLSQYVGFGLKSRLLRMLSVPEPD